MSRLAHAMLVLFIGLVFAHASHVAGSLATDGHPDVPLTTSASQHPSEARSTLSALQLPLGGLAALALMGLRLRQHRASSAR